MKKIIAILAVLSAVLVILMATPASAAKPQQNTLTVNQPAPYYSGQSVTFSTNVKQGKYELVLMMNCYRFITGTPDFYMVMQTSEQRGSLSDSYVIGPNSSYCVANLYEIVRGDYMVKAVLQFNVS